MTKVSIHRLVQIYRDNQKLEGSVELSGAKAKLLINRCKMAVKLMEDDCDGFAVEKLKEEIVEMEDSLAKSGKIRSIDYNLDARVSIHMAILEYNLFGTKSGWKRYYENWKVHWLEDGKPICGHVGRCGTSAPSWHLNRKQACSKCVKYVFNLIVNDHRGENLQDGSSYSGSAYGLSYEFKNGKLKEVKDQKDVD